MDNDRREDIKTRLAPYITLVGFKTRLAPYILARVLFKLLR